MASNADELERFLGQQLPGFTIEKLIEVYRTDGLQGLKIGSAGFFRDSDLAKAFIENQPKIAIYDMHETLLLVGPDRKFAFIIGDLANIVDESIVIFEVRKKILDKLSSAERAVIEQTE